MTDPSQTGGTTGTTNGTQGQTQRLYSVQDLPKKYIHQATLVAYINQRLDQFGASTQIENVQDHFRIINAARYLTNEEIIYLQRISYPAYAHLFVG